MWTTEVTGDSAATPAEVFAVLADPEHWHEWNDGVAGIRMNGPFAAGATAVMVFPDATELPFTLAWVEQDRGFEDVTEVPGAGVTVHVRHELEPTTAGTRITYRCTVDGPDPTAGDVGAGVSADFGDVIAALAARAEHRSL
ncbi:SRPBCC family protein [Nostocoides japonicum]|nr:SRPBCC family protein [Tetrasphaera japonica]